MNIKKLYMLILIFFLKLKNFLQIENQWRQKTSLRILRI